MPSIALNARFYSHALTGMQRYALELASRFAGNVDCIRPSTPLSGIRGHMWEQLYLPAAVHGRLLWSPNNTGPLAIAHQVCTIHDVAPLDCPEWFNPRFSALYKWLLPRLVHRVRHIIAVSNFTKERLLERFGIKPDKVTVVLSGVGNQFTPRPPEEIEEVRRELGIKSKNYVLSVGALVPRKNLPRMVEAWSRIQSSISDEIELILVGRGPGNLFPGYSLGELPPRVRLTGHVRDEYLPALYSGAMVMLCASLYEGFGLTPLEAMACGTPVITSNVTSLPEVVGDDAVLVDPTNVEEIAAALRDLIADEQRRADLRVRGVERARTYSWDTSAKETWSVLEAYAKD